MSWEVTFYSLEGDPPEDTVVGTITVDNGEILVDPPDDLYMQSLAHKAVIGYRPEKDPEGWIQNLYKEYRSYALRASKAVKK